MRTVSLILALLIAPLPLLRGQEPAPEVRALWVQRSSMTSPSAIRSLVRAAKGAGFNTLLVQVRGRGDACTIHLEHSGDGALRPTALLRSPGHR